MMFKRRDQRDASQFVGEARVIDPSEDTTELRGSAIEAAAEPQIVSTSAVIGQTIVVRGEITGDEDLLVEGRIEGSVALPKSRLTVGVSDDVSATINAKTLSIEGSINGDVAAVENVVLTSTGKMAGNIKAPRITLEDGCTFNGTIDMETEPTAVVTDLKQSTPSPTVKKPSEQHAV